MVDALDHSAVPTGLGRPAGVGAARAQVASGSVTAGPARRATACAAHHRRTDVRPAHVADRLPGPARGDRAVPPAPPACLGRLPFPPALPAQLGALVDRGPTFAGAAAVAGDLGMQVPVTGAAPALRHDGDPPPFAAPGAGTELASGHLLVEELRRHRRTEALGPRRAPAGRLGLGARSLAPSTANKLLVLGQTEHGVLLNMATGVLPSSPTSSPSTAASAGSCPDGTCRPPMNYHIAFGYASQQRNYYCVPATAQMLLGAAGVGSPTQDQLTYRLGTTSRSGSGRQTRRNPVPEHPRGHQQHPSERRPYHLEERARCGRPHQRDHVVRLVLPARGDTCHARVGRAQLDEARRRVVSCRVRLRVQPPESRDRALRRSLRLHTVRWPHDSWRVNPGDAWERSLAEVYAAVKADGARIVW